MSAKHKRPFVVFAAVALICGMVLFTGVRSKADNGLAAEPHSAAPGTMSGSSLSRLPDPQDPVTLGPLPRPDPDSEGGSSEEPDNSGPREFGTPPAEDEGSGGDDRDGNVPPDSFDGVTVGPQIEPDPDDDVPGDDQTLPRDYGKKDGKGRGGRGKKDKGDDKFDKDGDAGSDGEEPAEESDAPDQPEGEGDLPGDDVDVDQP